MSGALFPSPSCVIKGYGQLSTTLSAAVLLSTVEVDGVVGIPDGANYALLQAETADVRWTDDGTVPTANLGMLLKAGNDPLGFVGSQLRALQLIAASGSPKLNITFYQLR